MFSFAKIIHLDNDKKDYEYKPDKKQEYKTFSLALFNDPDKTKPIQSFNLNPFHNKVEETKKIDDYNINEFQEPKVAESKYEKFTSSKEVKPYNVEKGRYSNINTEDLLYKANITDQLANKIDSPDLDRLKQEILTRISLDDPNQDEDIQNLLNANMPKIIKKTRTGKAIMKQKVLNEIKDLQEQQLNSGLEIKPIEPYKRRQIKNNIYKQDLDINRDFTENQRNQVIKEIEPFVKPIKQAKVMSEIRQIDKEKKRRQKEKQAEETIRKAIKTRQQKKKAEKATKTLQARFRGQQVRLGRNEEGQQYLQAKTERQHAKNRKATQIQALARGKLARNKVENLKKEKPAKKIQAIARGKLARNKANKLREDIFNKEIENQETKKIRNKKLGIIEPEIMEAEPIQGQSLEEIDKVQMKASIMLEKFLRNEYTEKTFNQRIRLNTLREICKLSNIDYAGKTKIQMIKLIKERL